jgi:23S rRNA pseudouridine1911/1915/1917 synthase
MTQPSVPGKNAPPENAAGEPHGSGQTLTATAGPGDSGERLDRVLAAALAPNLSRARIQALIRQGHVTLGHPSSGGQSGGETISDPDLRVKQGQTFAIFVPDPVSATPKAQAIPLNVVYEDEALIVIDKPAGLVVHPAPGNPDLTLVNALIAHCGNSLSGIGGERRPGIVHRLDKDTSGLMVAAKNDRAHVALAAAFKARKIERAYTALVWGAPGQVDGKGTGGSSAAAAGEITGNIGRSPRNRKKMAVLRRGGRVATTRYRTVTRYGAKGRYLAARLECRLLTGRTHQIRVHLAHIGHPVIGDPTYGGASRRLLARLEESGGDAKTDDAASRAAAAVRALGRQALHAHLIGFDHPIGGDRLRFESALPPDIKALADSLESM